MKLIGIIKRIKEKEAKLREQYRKKYMSASAKERENLMYKASRMLGDRVQFWTYVNCKIDLCKEKVQNMHGLTDADNVLTEQ